MNKIVGEGITFDDLLLLPAYSDVLPAEANIQTRITKNIMLNIPILSAPMDTVTESELAIALAREGGIGIIHKNLSIDDQLLEVVRVKRSEYAIIQDPITLSPEEKIGRAIEIMNEKKISGFPIVKNNVLVGILTRRDLRFKTNLDDPIATHMTQTNLVTAPEGTTLHEATGILSSSKVEKLPIVNNRNELRGLITLKDINKTLQYPNSCKDLAGRLRVGAAVGVTPKDRERAYQLNQAALDVFVVDTAHGHSKAVAEMIQFLKKEFPRIDVIAGNVATAEGCEFLIKAGADAVKVGIGPGSICTTRVVAGVGVPQITAVMEAYKMAKKNEIPVISDGGIKFSGDIIKAIAAGANAVMIGNLFARTLESPGELVHHQGKAYKEYRGMGSIGAMKAGSSDRYQQADTKKLVPEGVEGRVPYKGTLSDYIYQLIGGIKSGMGYCGSRTIKQLQDTAQFIKISHASFVESHTHDVVITKEAPNYGVNE